jgi:DNA-binding NtrC family response regulator
MRAGAFDYLLKPLPSNDALRLVVERAVARRRLVEENRRLRQSLSPQVRFDTLAPPGARAPCTQPRRIRGMPS